MLHSTEPLRRNSLSAFSLFLCHWPVQVSYLLNQYWVTYIFHEILFHQNIKTFSIRSCIVCTYNCKIPTLVVALSLTFLILFMCFLFCKPKGSLYTSLSCYLKFKSYLYINYIISDFTLYWYMLLSLSFYPSRISVPPPPPSPGHNSSF